jgi:hypothetical protein
VCLAGCTQDGVAKARVIQGAPITSPSAFQEPDAPTPSKLAGKVTVTDASIQDLKDALTEFFIDPHPDQSANALLVLNPTEEALVAYGGAGAASKCKAGKFRACLILSNLETQGFSTRVQPYSAAFELNSKEVFKLGGQMLDVETLDGTHPVQDLTPGDNAPDPTSGIPLLLALAPLQGLPFLEGVPPFGEQQEALQYDNLEVPLVVVPSQMHAGAYGGFAGVWLPVTFTMPDQFVRFNSCSCDGSNYSTLPEKLCQNMCAESHGCQYVDMWTKLSQFTTMIGFIPSIRPGCDSLSGVTTGAYSDPYTAWMKNVFGGHEWRQPCLDVTVQVRAGAFVEAASSKEAVSTATGNAIRIDANHCPGYNETIGDAVADAACEIAEGDTCDNVATKGAAPALAAQLELALAGAMQLQLQPFLEYSGYDDPNGPYANGPPQGPACVLGVNCKDDDLKKLIPASINIMTYSWFAGAFGPSGPAWDIRPWQQYPVYKTELACPDGSRIEASPLSWILRCRKCPMGGDWTGMTGSFECFDWFVGYTASVEVPELGFDLYYSADPDGDGKVAPQDNCPFVKNQYQTNSDGDSLGDSCDNCQYVHNEGQEDIDGDGKGDACDPCNNNLPDLDGDGTPDECETLSQCPCDPVDPALTHDIDGLCDRCEATLGGPGSFCAKYCAGPVVVDNCPGVWNADQKNCNKTWEVALGAELLGDACDPVPCPKAETEHATELSTSEGPFVNQFNQFCWEKKSQMGLSDINLSPMGSHAAPDTVLPPGIGKGKVVEKNVMVGITRYRYCVNSKKFNWEVKCAQLDWYKDAERLAEGQPRSDELWASGWHKISVTGGSSLLPMDADPNHFDPKDTSLAYGHDDLTQQQFGYARKWDWQADFNFWKDTWGGEIDLVLPTTGKEGENGAGVLWTYAKTPAGMDLDINTGIHPRPGGWGVDANRIADFAIETAVVQTSSSVTCAQYWNKPPLEIPIVFVRVCELCNGPGSVGDIHQYVEKDTGPLVLPAPGESIHAGQLVVRAPAGMGQAAVLRPDGSLTPIDGLIGQHLSSSLASNLVWVSQAEAFASIGGGGSAPAAVALSPDGTSVAEVAFLSGGKLLGLHDTSLTHGGGMAAKALQPASIVAPPTRQGFTAVYARADNRVFVVGGTDPLTHNPIGDIWYRQTFGDERWFRVDLTGFAPARVLAATSSYLDHRLWVLDELSQGKASVVRLHRVDPQTGGAELLGTWPKSSNYDGHWLALDVDGTILLTTSSTKLNRYFVIRIDNASNPLAIGGITAGHRTLAAAPMVDGDGYMLLEVHGQNHLSMERLTALAAKPGHWDDVGACM